MIRYIKVEEIKQRNLINEEFCAWIDELEKVCREQLKMQDYEPLTLDEVACLNSFSDGMTPYQTFREDHFNN